MKTSPHRSPSTPSHERAASIPVILLTRAITLTSALRPARALEKLRRFHAAHRQFARINTPIVMLLSLLQRTPMDRVIAAADEIIVGSPSGAVLRSSALAVASLGAMDSLAGATTLSPTMESPVAATVGTNVNVGFGVLNTINIGSWKLTGTLPPGMTLSAKEGGNVLTGPGTLDATSPGVSNGYGGTTGGNATTTAILTGTPTTPGTYTFNLQAFEFGNLQGLASDTFAYTVTVAAAGPTPVAPTITDPLSQSVQVGSSVSFTVTVTGTPTPTVQWQKGGVAINGATNSTYTISSVQTTDAGAYTAVATSTAGTATSHAATLTVTAATAAPVFTLQPTSQTIATGNTVVFNAAATDATSYRWQLNNVDIPGATDAQLKISNSSSANAGTYSVIATNATGSTTSSAATLTVSTVSAAETGHLSNLSVRTNSGTGDQVLNVGFAIGGAGTSGTKPLLVRVTGPALAAFGVAGTMPDPTLTVRPLSSQTVVAADDNWNGDSTVAATSNAVGAFGITDTHSADAALVTSLAGGSYTAVAADKNNGTGIVLTEIYDATPSASFTGTTPRLVNVSARAQVGTGDGVLVVGFAIAGSTSKTLLIRASGPALAAFGVGGTLADPELQIFRQNGPKLYENDNWGGSLAIANASSGVGAFAFNDANSKDAAVLVTLPPGVYTAEAKGADGGTGIALVELYEVP